MFRDSYLKQWKICFSLFACNLSVTDIAKLFRKSTDFLPSLNFCEKISQQRDLQCRTTHIMQSENQSEVSTALLLIVGHFGYVAVSTKIFLKNASLTVQRFFWDKTGHLRLSCQQQDNTAYGITMIKLLRTNPFNCTRNKTNKETKIVEITSKIDLFTLTVQLTVDS